MRFLAISLQGLALGSALALVGCSSDSSGMMRDSLDDMKKDAAGPPEMDASQTGAAGDAQTPAMGSEITAWLESGDYKKWSCEPAVHAARAPSPHGFNRICSNGVLSAHAAGTDAWPVGAAAVKELHASESSTTPVGYAVYLKTKDDSAGGANWYWYEIVPSDSAAPHDDKGVVADGLGATGTAKSICVGCHAAAGSDAPHTPSPGGRDQVYTPVP